MYQFAIGFYSSNLINYVTHKKRIKKIFYTQDKKYYIKFQLDYLENS